MHTRIGLAEARALVASHIDALPADWRPLPDLAGRICAADLEAHVDVPDADVSRKDGYAVLPADLAGASPERPVSLQVVGSINAGAEAIGRVVSGQALRVTTGARLPEGLSVLAEEFTAPDGERILCKATAGPGRNVMARGTDVARGEVVARAGQRLSPGAVGLLAAAGMAGAEVHPRPLVAVLATGDEVVPPGQPLRPGQVYASNLVELIAWLTGFGLPTRTEVAGDSAAEITAALKRLLVDADAVLTTGGAWTSEKDLMMQVFEALGWQGVFHRVRLGPGKGVGFGLLDGKPVFCLPGGPPSCEMAFLQLALPGILRLAGWTGPVFPSVGVRLAEDLKGAPEWTQCIHARIERREDGPWAVPLRSQSRLKSMARAEALIRIPEGTAGLSAGQVIPVQALSAAGCCPSGHPV